MKRIKVGVSQQPERSGRLPADGQIFLDQAEGRSRATTMHSANNAEVIRNPQNLPLQVVSDFVDRSDQSPSLRREALGKFTAVEPGAATRSG